MGFAGTLACALVLAGSRALAQESEPAMSGTVAFAPGGRAVLTRALRAGDVLTAATCVGPRTNGAGRREIRLVHEPLGKHVASSEPACEGRGARVQHTITADGEYRVVGSCEPRGASCGGVLTYMVQRPLEPAREPERPRSSHRVELAGDARLALNVGALIDARVSWWIEEVVVLRVTAMAAFNFSSGTQAGFTILTASLAMNGGEIGVGGGASSLRDPPVGVSHLGEVPVFAARFRVGEESEFHLEAQAHFAHLADALHLMSLQGRLHIPIDSTFVMWLRGGGGADGMIFGEVAFSALFDGDFELRGTLGAIALRDAQITAGPAVGLAFRGMIR